MTIARLIAVTFLAALNACAVRPDSESEWANNYQDCAGRFDIRGVCAGGIKLKDLVRAHKCRISNFPDEQPGVPAKLSVSCAIGKKENGTDDSIDLQAGPTEHGLVVFAVRYELCTYREYNSVGVNTPLGDMLRDKYGTRNQIDTNSARWEALNSRAEKGVSTPIFMYATKPSLLSFVDERNDFMNVALGVSRNCISKSSGPHAHGWWETLFSISERQAVDSYVDRVAEELKRRQPAPKPKL